MDRRSFIRGVVEGVAASGLVVSASPAEIASLAKPGESILVTPTHADIPNIGMYLFNDHGQVVAIVTEVHISPRTIDVTTFHDRHHYYTRGFGGPEIDIRAVGVAGARFANSEFVRTCIYCGRTQNRNHLGGCISCGAALPR